MCTSLVTKSTCKTNLTSVAPARAPAISSIDVYAAAKLFCPSSVIIGRLAPLWSLLLLYYSYLLKRAIGLQYTSCMHGHPSAQAWIVHVRSVTCHGLGVLVVKVTGTGGLHGISGSDDLLVTKRVSFSWWFRPRNADRELSMEWPVPIKSQPTSS